VTVTEQPTTVTEQQSKRTYDVGRSLSTDYFGLRDQLGPDELEILLRARAFVDDEVLPVINEYWEKAEFPRELVKRMGELHLAAVSPLS